MEIKCDICKKEINGNYRILSFNDGCGHDYVCKKCYEKSVIEYRHKPFTSTIKSTINNDKNYCQYAVDNNATLYRCMHCQYHRYEHNDYNGYNTYCDLQ